ncbi:hypothetical protein TI39_contig442g00005 [Zymoseptoria brevis]|uniref:Uncharacterized protein n=1 Tax=Zymoseptoria brevis TaxID=1047168 RepID=A0A0F4GKW2_9PEZI|nr:hypothetical protein TI39_contig442g00005 [Zymoseptoria brevis]
MKTIFYFTSLLILALGALAAPAPEPVPGPDCRGCVGSYDCCVCQTGGDNCGPP